MTSLPLRTYATGKRKTAVARVWIQPGQGLVTINGHPVEQYFERKTNCVMAHQSLNVTESLASFDVMATCKGGGKSAQAAAVRHGVARALCTFDLAYREVLKKAGFLTRDARKKERKKPGQPGARARFQYSKR